MIKIEKLIKYYGNECVLNGISLHIEEGEVVIIVGPSGSGKSTLLRCINYLDTPNLGKIIINNVEVNQDNAQVIRKKVGMVFQNFFLFPHMTVLENITYAPRNVLKISDRLAKSHAKELLEKVGLSDKASAFPHSLSGGQKQRVAIARTLAMKPEIILFDEATSALDPEMCKEVLDVIRSLAHTGITIVMVTHEMGFARELADRMIFLNEGKILEQATPDAFFTKPKHIRVKQFLEKVLKH